MKTFISGFDTLRREKSRKGSCVARISENCWISQITTWIHIDHKQNCVQHNLMICISSECFGTIMFKSRKTDKPCSLHPRDFDSSDSSFETLLFTCKKFNFKFFINIWKYINKWKINTKIYFLSLPPPPPVRKRFWKMVDASLKLFNYLFDVKIFI